MQTKSNRKLLVHNENNIFMRTYADIRKADALSANFL